MKDAKAVLLDIKREIREKAVYSHNSKIEPYIGLKVVDAILNNHIRECEEKECSSQGS